MRLSLLAMLAALLCAPGIASAESDMPATSSAASTTAQTMPAPVPAPAPAIGDSAPLRLQEPELKLNRGWGKAAGNVGVGVGLGLAGLGLGVAVAEYRYFGMSLGGPGPGLLLAIGTMITSAIVVPVVALGSSSSRLGAGVEGSPAARVAGWFAYGLSILAPLPMLLFDAPEVAASAVAMLGTFSMILHGIDARTAGLQASEKIGAGGGATVVPSLAPVSLDDGRTGLALGLAGRF